MMATRKQFNFLVRCNLQGLKPEREVVAYYVTALLRNDKKDVFQKGGTKENRLRASNKMAVNGITADKFKYKTTPWQPASVHNKVSRLSKIYRDLCKMGQCDSNPFEANPYVQDMMKVLSFLVGVSRTSVTRPMLPGLREKVMSLLRYDKLRDFAFIVQQCFAELRGWRAGSYTTFFWRDLKGDSGERGLEVTQLRNKMNKMQVSQTYGLPCAAECDGQIHVDKEGHLVFEKRCVAHFLVVLHERQAKSVDLEPSAHDGPVFGEYMRVLARTPQPRARRFEVPEGGTIVSCEGSGPSYFDANRAAKVAELRVARIHVCTKEEEAAGEFYKSEAGFFLDGTRKPVPCKGRFFEMPGTCEHAGGPVVVQTWSTASCLTGKMRCYIARYNRSVVAKERVDLTLYSSKSDRIGLATHLNNLGCPDSEILSAAGWDPKSNMLKVYIRGFLDPLSANTRAAALARSGVVTEAVIVQKLKAENIALHRLVFDIMDELARMRAIVCVGEVQPTLSEASRKLVDHMRAELRAAETEGLDKVLERASRAFANGPEPGAEAGAHGDGAAACCDGGAHEVEASNDGEHELGDGALMQRPTRRLVVWGDPMLDGRVYAASRATVPGAASSSTHGLEDASPSRLFAYMEEAKTLPSGATLVNLTKRLHTLRVRLGVVPTSHARGKKRKVTNNAEPADPSLAPMETGAAADELTALQALGDYESD
jgi:hypothetical protein